MTSPNLMKAPMASSKRIILADADVISHFITGGRAEDMHLIFPGHPIHVLDKVHAELQRWPDSFVRTQISFLFSKKILRLIDFPEDDDSIKKEYNWIKSMLFKGDGESACLAVARYNHQILASSNLKDIKTYCSMHKIDYLTTMDFLCEALRTGFFTEQECDDFIQKVRIKSKLPVQSIRGYNCRAITFLTT